MGSNWRIWTHSCIAVVTLAGVVAPANPVSADPAAPPAIEWGDPHIDTIDGAPLSDDEIALFEYHEPSGLSPQAVEGQVYTWEGKPEAATDPDYDTDVALTATTYVPDEVMEVIQTSFYDLRKVIDFDITGFMHDIEIEWSSELPSGALGGTSTRWHTFQENGVWYRFPGMLAETQAQQPLSQYPAMKITINAEVDWILDTYPTDHGYDSRYVLKTVMLHEILHGLGIAPGSNGLSQIDSAQRSTWERAMYIDRDLDRPWEDSPSSNVEQNDLWFRNLDGTWERVYDPSTYAPGSSIGHLDESTYQNDPGYQVDAGALMTPFLYNGEVAVPDGVIAGLLDVVGWDTRVAPGTPSITSAVGDGNAVRIALEPNTDGAYAPAQQWAIEATDGNDAVVASLTVAATERTIVLEAGTDAALQISVTAITSGGSSPAARQWSVPGPPSSTTTTTAPPTTSTTVPSTTTTTPAPTTTPTTTASTTTTAPTTTPTTTTPVRAGLPLERATSIAEIIASADYRSSDADTLRLYRAFFSREPDTTGTKYWLTQARQGIDYDQMAWAFAASTEFRETYGSPDDLTFLSIVYANVLGRNSDPAGFDYWLSKLEGGMSRHQVVRWVAASSEFARSFPYQP